MTIHFDKPDYECPKCKAVFLPYKIGIKCPNCGVLIPDADVGGYSDSIANIAGSMGYHKSIYGTYCPGAWLFTNFMDHIQAIIFQLFDAFELEKPENEEEYLMNSLENNFQWDDQAYLKNHVKEIAIELLAIYRAEEFSKIVRIEFESKSKTARFKRWFNKFIP